MTLQHYLTVNREPAKILCILKKVSYYQLPKHFALLPGASNLVVDHVERDLLSEDNDVVYVRFPSDLKVG